jgi:hypothetical protein
MKGSIIKIWCIIDGYTGETLNEYTDYKDAKAALKYRYDASIGDHIKAGLVYEIGDYGSPVYFGETLAEARKALKRGENL